MKHIFKFIFLFFFLFSQSILSQSKEDLETKKQVLKTEIQNIETLIKKSTNKKRDLLTNVENLKFKINLQKDLISNINSQLNIIVDQIESNNLELKSLSEKQEKTKKEYAEMVLKSYKHKSSLNKIMFVFSSNNFAQAYKRLQYYKQYVKYKDKQINEIKLTTKLIDSVLKGLKTQRAEKQVLIDENQNIKDNLDNENLQQEKMILEIRKDEKRYANQIKTKQKQSLELSLIHI